MFPVHLFCFWKGGGVQTMPSLTYDCFQEGVEKKIDLTGNPFTADNVHNLLKFMYTMEDESFTGKRILDVYGVADYFMVDHLRYKALDCLHSLLQHNARHRWWQNFCTIALKVLEKYSFGDVHRVLVEVIAKHFRSIMWDNDKWLWEQLKVVQPDIMDQVHKVRFPDQKEPHLESQLFQPIDRPAARATQAFDDIPPIRSRSRSGSSRRQPLRDVYRSTPYKY